MDTIATFIVGRDHSGKEIILTMLVDKEKNITFINLAGISLHEELQDIETPKLPNDLYEYFKNGNPVDLTKQFSEMSVDEIKEFFVGKLKRGERIWYAILFLKSQQILSR